MKKTWDAATRALIVGMLLLVAAAPAPANDVGQPAPTAPPPSQADAARESPVENGGDILDLRGRFDCVITAQPKPGGAVEMRAGSLPKTEARQ